MQRRLAIVILAAFAAAALLVGPAGCAPARISSPSDTSATPPQLTLDSWSAIEANPNAFSGRTVSITGEVFAPYDAQSSPPNLQMFVQPQDISGVAVVTMAADPGVKKGDRISVLGKILGQYTGAGPFAGSDMTAVLVEAQSVEPTSAPASEAP